MKEEQKREMKDYPERLNSPNLSSLQPRRQLTVQKINICWKIRTHLDPCTCSHVHTHACTSRQTQTHTHLISHLLTEQFLINIPQRWHLIISLLLCTIVTTHHKLHETFTAFTSSVSSQQVLHYHLLIPSFFFFFLVWLQ